MSSVAACASALWNAQPVRAAGLPAAFWDFAKKLGSDYGVVKLLKLTAEYGIPAVLSAMEAAASVGSYAYEAVRTRSSVTPRGPTKKDWLSLEPSRQRLHKAP